MAAINTTNIRQNNRNRIYRFILESGKVSKQDISYTLHLSLPTVTQIVKELQEMGLITEDGIFDSSVGRKARAISPLPNAHLSLGLDITEHHLTFALLNLQGTVVRSLRKRFRLEDSEEGYQRLSDEIDLFLDSASTQKKSLLGIGISIPGIVSGDGKQIFTATVINISKDFYHCMEPHIKVPFFLLNDANSGGFAETWRSPSLKNVVYISLSNTVGGATILNGTPYLGSNYRGGEIGHINLYPNGKQCYCGQRGHADPYCSASVLSQLANDDLEQFFKNVESGDEKCNNALDVYLEDLSLLITSVREFLDCDIILGGYVGKFLGKYLNKLSALVMDKTRFEDNTDFLRVGTLGYEVAATGCGLHFIDQFVRSV